MNGVCREGDRCHFSHNRDSSRPSMICRYYLKGNCYYGRSCSTHHHTTPLPLPIPVPHHTTHIFNTHHTTANTTPHHTTLHHTTPHHTTTMTISSPATLLDRYDHTWPGHQSGSEYSQTEGPPTHLGESSQQGPACTNTSRHKDTLSLSAPHVQSSQPSLLSQRWVWQRCCCSRLKYGHEMKVDLVVQFTLP
ncbi:putative E3 ubiquitin-protein ligase makorin-2 [Portunus trituberculatus]|uniref:Putative E3 ubiquitin-protein ligase makorin-2 n=1 Tax=Portunus trituberculatus TaxID=210409 RepID=A0A5B7HY02_PORTR|nr:putative E3 ubiquitin-protein ligase makorin-2 [Portunus trituberculatus]